MVVGVSTGAQARQPAEQVRPDVTLVDIDLGEESGLTVARDLSAAVLPAPPDSLN